MEESLDELFNQYSRLKRQRQWDAALEILERCREIDPRHQILHRELIEIYSLRGRVDDLAKECLRFIEALCQREERDKIKPVIPLLLGTAKDREDSIKKLIGIFRSYKFTEEFQKFTLLLVRELIEKEKRDLASEILSWLRDNITEADEIFNEAEALSRELEKIQIPLYLTRDLSHYGHSVLSSTLQAIRSEIAEKHKEGAAPAEEEEETGSEKHSESSEEQHGAAPAMPEPAKKTSLKPLEIPVQADKLPEAARRPLDELASNIVFHEEEFVLCVASGDGELLWMSRKSSEEMWSNLTTFPQDLAVSILAPPLLGGERKFTCWILECETGTLYLLTLDPKTVLFLILPSTERVDLWQKKLKSTRLSLMDILA